VSRQMKSALIRNILDLWILEKGGRWEKIEGRPGERPHEYLIGEPELPYTSLMEIGRVHHYEVRFNEPVAQPLAAPCSSDKAEHLSEKELLDIINNPPPEELRA
jgi:UDP-N-acetylglucosamine 4,6-dehydratase/5-epimerase